MKMEPFQFPFELIDRNDPSVVENEEEEEKARRDYSRLEKKPANFPLEGKEIAADCFEKGRRATFGASVTQPEDRRCIVVAYHRKKPYS